ncbi:MAG: hypothetical protein GY757_05255 [bacterium]|nr:hypothetical protein [bacterium]
MKTCPYCGADDLLPFESDEEPGIDYSFLVILLSAFLVFLGYFVFVISSYIYFPVAIFIFIIISAKVINRNDERKKKEATIERDYLCAECGGEFRA